MPELRPQGDPTAAEIMIRTPRTCSPFSTVTEAALILQDAGCGAVPILDDGKPVGILTDRDIALAAARYPDLGARLVSEVMSRDPVTVSPSDGIEALSARFGETQVHRLLVASDDGRLAGIISVTDLAPHLEARRDGPLTSRFQEDATHRPGIRRDRVEPAPGEAPAGGRDTWAWAHPGEIWVLLRTTAGDWSRDKVPRLGAALAFYSVLSIAPLLLIAIAVAALVFGREAASGQLIGQIRNLVGKEGAEAIQEMLQHAQKPGTGVLAALIGFATLMFAASGVFGELQDAMNTIWEVRPKPGRGILGMLRGRFLSFSMVLGTGFLLLTSLVLSTAVAATFGYLSGVAPGVKSLLAVVDFATSAAVILVLFAMIFKLLPDAKVAWRDVWVGSALTTVLFLVGKAAIGAYLGQSSYGSAYGAAGSLVVLIVWIYYSSQILFFGAEFTKVYANRYGSRIEPSAGAERVTAEEQARQGMPRTAAATAT